MGKLLGVPLFIIPIFSGAVWLAMLLGMLLWWIIDQNSRHLPSMSSAQHIAYISDIGSTELQPLFIAMGTVTVVTFDFVFIAERWSRHGGILHPNTSAWQKVLSVLAILFSLAGGVALILLTCYNNRYHQHTHDICLGVFIIGYIIAAIFICWEYQRLGVNHRQHRVLAISFWIKLTFIIVEIALAIAFATLSARKEYNKAAILEWIVALIYAFFVWSFAIDFLPAIRTKHYASKMTEVEMGERMEQDARNRGYPNGVEEEQAAYNNGSYINGNNVNGNYVNSNNANDTHVVNNVKYTQPRNVIPELPSRNF